MEAIIVNDYKFNYTKEGNGKPVMFVHGSLNDLRSWENQTKYFSKQYNVITYSRRYHYPNKAKEPISDYSVSVHSNDLVELIKSMDLDQVNLVGSSYGAYVALMASMQIPDRVKSLVLGEPPVISFLVSDVDNKLQALSLLIKDFQTGKSFIKLGVKGLNPAKEQFQKGNLTEGVRLFVNGVIGEGAFEELPEMIKSNLMDNSIALKAEMLGPGFPQEFPNDKAEKLQVPVLLVYGEKSLKFFHTISDKLEKLLPKSHKLKVSNASHDIHQDNPEYYNTKVREFIEEYN
jgi:pimeloyl-ACP methyl ester carboxylesterase